MSDPDGPDDEPEFTDAEIARLRKKFGWEPGDVEVKPPPDPPPEDPS